MSSIFDSRVNEEQNLPEIATYHFYFTNEVLELANTTSDGIAIFGFGEDGFVTELYEYAKVFWLSVDDCYKSYENSPSVVAYDLPEKLSEIFWSMADTQNGILPKIEEFKLKVIAICDEYFNRK